MFIQECPQYSPKLSASNACMLATFSMRVYIPSIYLSSHLTWPDHQLKKCTSGSSFYTQPKFIFIPPPTNLKNEDDLKTVDWQSTHGAENILPPSPIRPLSSCRQGKSRKHASIACGQFLRKLWTFLDQQQFSFSFYPSMPTNLFSYSQSIHFC